MATSPTGVSDVLVGTVSLTATTTASAVASVDFQYAPPGTPSDGSDWTTAATAPGGLGPYTGVIDTTQIPDGLYDFRAVVNEPDGTMDQSSTLDDYLIANDSPVVVLKTTPVLQLGSAVSSNSGTITIRGNLLTTTSEFQNAAQNVQQIALQYSPYSATDADDWTTIGAPANVTPGSPGAVFTLPTGSLPDGAYDFRVVPIDVENNVYDSVPLRGIVVHNAPPMVSLDAPVLSSDGTLSLSVQTSDLELQGTVTGSGLAQPQVQYERAIAGTGDWSLIGSASATPFSDSFDTTTWATGAYDLRAVATDRAGNTQTSNVVQLSVTNPPVPPLPAISTRGMAVPAHDIHIIGYDATTQTTWAYGTTGAPPAIVDGQPLPYTAPGDQLVLLTHDDADGWQIADVLRCSDGTTPFPVGPNTSTDPVMVTGQMAPSGEAWLAVWQKGSAEGANPDCPDGSSGGELYGLFHRLPGGQFVRDDAASDSPDMTSLFTGNGTGGDPLGELRLGTTSAGQVYGILTAPGEAGASVLSSGDPITQQPDYALLDPDGTWTAYTATLPQGYSLPTAGNNVTLSYADVTGPDTGWGVFTTGEANTPLLLAQFNGDAWSYVDTGLDALDLSNGADVPGATISATGLKADGSAVWVGANIDLPGTSATSAPIVARYDAQSGKLTNSWCTLPVANGCAQPLDAEHPAVVPQAIFDTASGSTALAVTSQNSDGEYTNEFSAPGAPIEASTAINVFAHGVWSAIPVPGYSPGDDVFTGFGQGWLGGYSGVAQVTAGATSGPLTTWPISDRAPLTSVALPPGSDAGVDESGALAVGLDGTALEYEAATGWQDLATPSVASHLSLTSVAFDGPATAFAVGADGLILRWDGSSWSEDSFSRSVPFQLNDVAFGSDGEGWAVGADGAILHFNGQGWSVEQPPADDSGTNITSVAVAGSDVYAIAGGNLIVRESGGTWQDADPSVLPDQPAPAPGTLRVVAGLPDGGAVIGGQGVLLIRQAPTAADPTPSFRYSDQPVNGIVTALAPFESDGVVRTALSLAPPAVSPYPQYDTGSDVGGYPAGDGELLIQTAGGWQDLSETQPAGAAPPVGTTLGDPSPLAATGGTDGEVHPDPVLAVAVSPDGEHAWAVGGYDGTPTAVGLGSGVPTLAARPVGWQTASVWRYDAGGSAAPPTLSTAPPSLPATPGTVSFAFFANIECYSECAATQEAQPDTNLAGAIQEINSYAAQPGGPAFAMLGGDAVGPYDYNGSNVFGNGNSAVDFANLPDLLAPLDVPLFAAYGPHDAVSQDTPASEAFDDAFADAPAPFANGGSVPGITPISSGAAQPGTVSHYYSFDAHQNGATLRVIVLDNSTGSLGPAQTGWLQQQLAAAGVPTVVVAAQPLYGNATTDGPSVAAMLVAAGVLAVFTGDPPDDQQTDQVNQVPEGATQTIPEYEGATLGYQQSQNDGVTWYEASVDTQQDKVSVDAVPLIQSLSLDPQGGSEASPSVPGIQGLTVFQNQTLSFTAIGRRPAGSLASRPSDGASPAPGYDNYVEIPASSCATCITPTYSFSSSNPAVGIFVKPNASGSKFPAYAGSGKVVASGSSGLFCALNPGTTNISITAGLLTYSLPVTVVSVGGYGPWCNNVPYDNVEAAAAIVASTARVIREATNNGAAAVPPPPPGPAGSTPSALPAVHIPAPAPAPPPAPVKPPAPAAPTPAVHTPAPAPTPATPAPVIPGGPPPIVTVVPPTAPPVEPVPPGGATAPSQAAARRREKAHKHASQSAYTLVRPVARTADPAAWWYYGGVGLAMVLSLGLVGQAIRPRRRPQELRPAEARARDRAPRRR